MKKQERHKRGIKTRVPSPHICISFPYSHIQFLLTLHRGVRRGFPAEAYSWGRRSAGGIFRSDTGEMVETGVPKIQGCVRAWCDARGHCRTKGSSYAQCI